MFLFAQQTIPASQLWVGLIGELFLVGTLWVWIRMGIRFFHGKAVLPPYEPRKSVPWSGLHLLAILCFYLFFMFAIFSGIRLWEQAGGQRIAKPAGRQPTSVECVSAAREKKTTLHPLAQSLKEKDLLVLVQAFTVGVVLAPVFEEFFFRLLLLGWLDSSERRWRRRCGRALGALPRGLLPIVLSALPFAALHFRAESAEADESSLALSLCIAGLANLFTLFFAVVLVHRHTGATAQDFGWDGARLGEDFRTGVAAFFAITLPIYALQMGLALYILPKSIASDPITLFFFAIALGLLYYRTHRIVPSIVLHALLNASSLAMAWFLL
jgi:membrane protease YdiL (CAAX protease family)